VQARPPIAYNGIAHLAGQLANNHDGDIRVQTAGTLARIDVLLAEAGIDKSRILPVTIYLKDIDADFAGLNEVWEAWVTGGQGPAWACVEVAMFKPSLLVEMSVIAVRADACRSLHNPKAPCTGARSLVPTFKYRAYVLRE
jgi:enamine deaminase RidA (YjgF/YER057c/UK114 family)